MAYTKTAWVNDSAPPVDAINLNKIEQGIYDAHQMIAAFQGVPTGMVLPFAGPAAPSGWLVCDGSAVSRTVYAALHALLKDVGGTNAYAWGAGDGTTTFNLPDFRGRMPVGVGTHADVDALAKNDGGAVANRRPKHKHSVTDPGHTHNTGRDVHSLTPGSTPYSLPNPGGTYDYATDSHTTGIAVGPQSGAELIDTVPFLVVSFLVKT